MVNSIQSFEFEPAAKLRNQPARLSFYFALSFLEFRNDFGCVFYLFEKMNNDIISFLGLFSTSPAKA